MFYPRAPARGTRGNPTSSPPWQGRGCPLHAGPGKPPKPGTMLGGARDQDRRAALERAGFGPGRGVRGACAGAFRGGAEKINETYVRQEYYYLVFCLWIFTFCAPRRRVSGRLSNG